LHQAELSREKERAAALEASALAAGAAHSRDLEREKEARARAAEALQAEVASVQQLLASERETREQVSFYRPHVRVCALSGGGGGQFCCPAPGWVFPKGGVGSGLPPCSI